MSSRTIGMFLVIISAITFSTAGIFTKGVSADAGSVLFWRGFSAASFALVYLAMRRQLRHEMAVWGMPSLLATVTMGMGTLCFLTAFKLTSVVNVAVIWATVPFFSAFLAWALLGEKASLRLLICSGFAFLGAVITLGVPNFSLQSWGNVLALMMTIFLALTMVIYRHWPQTPTTFPTAMSSLLVMLVVLGWTNPLETKGHEIAILLTFGGVFAVAAVTMLEGAKRLSPVEVSLLGTLETPIAPLFAFLILAEVPPLMAIVGGGIVLIAVIVAQRRQT